MLSIRQFRQEDWEDVRRLFVECQRQFSAGAERELESYIKDSMEGDLADIDGSYLQSTGGNFWVVENAGQVVGMVGVQRKDATSCELRRMAVDIQWRRQGLARKLLETAEAFARKQGYNAICLSTITLLKGAIALYESAGYLRTGQSHYGAVTALHYSKELFSDPNPQGDGQN